MVGKVVWTTLKLLGFIGLIINAEKEVVEEEEGGGGGGEGFSLWKGHEIFSIYAAVKKPHLILEERAQVYVYRIKSEMDSLNLVNTIIRSWKEIQSRP